MDTTLLKGFNPTRTSLSLNLWASALFFLTTDHLLPSSVVFIIGQAVTLIFSFKNWKAPDQPNLGLSSLDYSAMGRGTRKKWLIPLSQLLRLEGGGDNSSQKELEWEKEG